MSKRDNQYVYNFIGKNVRKYRKEAHMTQEELANAAHYSKQLISNMENNAYQTFSIDTLWEISKVLHVDFYKLCIEPEDDEEKKDEIEFI